MDKPRGLTTPEIEQYMMLLSSSKVLRLGSDGLTYRSQQIVYQLPLHDFSEIYMKFLPKDQKVSFETSRFSTLKDSMGQGNIFISLVLPCTYCTSPRFICTILLYYKILIEL